MNIRSRGIVLQAIKYSDSSLIAKVFTEETGLQSYLVKGVYKRRSKFRPALFQPMTLIELVANHRPNKDLHFLSEISLELPYNSIPFDMNKNAMILFFSELLSKSIREEEANPKLFAFLHQSMHWLDLCKHRFVDFPLYFCLELSRYLGFYPKPESGGTFPVFDMLNGLFLKTQPSHTHYVLAPISHNLKQLCHTPLEQLAQLRWSNEERRQLLAVFIDYYRLHLPGVKGIQSQEILRQVMEQG